MATGTGFLDPAMMKWDAAMLKSAELSPENLRPLSDAPATVGGAAARTRVVDASPRPERPNRELIQDAGDAGELLASFLVERGFA